MTHLRTFDRSAGEMLLGLTGAAGAGKDTCASLLQSIGFASLAFADALREEVSEAWRIDPRMLTYRGTKEWPIPALAIANCCDGAFVERMAAHGHDLGDARSPRWIMQRWGTEYRRAESGGGYWIAAAIARLITLRRQGCRRIVITDVRFDNEVQAILAMGGATVQVVRPAGVNLAADTEGHASTQLPAGIEPEAVHNDGDFRHLGHELLRVLGTLGWRNSDPLPWKP